MSLIRSGTILFIASMVGNISNYLFQFFMSRHLTLEDYGAMNALFSMMVIIGLPTGTIMLVIARYISIFKTKGEEDKISALYQNSLAKMAAVGGVFFFPFLIFNNPITSYLKINTGWPVIIIGIEFFLAFVVTVNLGMLQGLQRFYYFGIGMGLGGFFKLLFGIVLILLGFGLNGAVAAVVFSALFVFALTTIPLSAYFKRRKAVESHTRDILLYSIPVLLSSIAFTIMTNIDLMIVKHFFPPKEAGLYAAISILGKTILYLPAALVLALFPMVSESHALNHDAFKILDKGVLYTVAISLIGVLGFLLFPELAIKILFGNRFVAAAPLLKFYGLAMMFMAIISILINFNLARHRTEFIYSLGAGCVVLITLINLFHDSLLTVIFIIMAISISLAVVNLMMVYKDRKAFYQIRAIEMKGAEER